MVLATYGEHPWVATLYFAYDEQLQLYFLSSPETLHGRQIEQNAKVAVAIADSPQDPAQKKKGLQVYGEARRLRKETEVRRALQLWKKALRVTSKDYSYEGIKTGLIAGRMYVVRPRMVKLFDQERWEEGEEPILNL